MYYETRKSKDGRREIIREYKSFWQTPIGIALIIALATLLVVMGGFDDLYPPSEFVTKEIRK